MKTRNIKCLALALFILIGFVVSIGIGQELDTDRVFTPVIPKTWDDQAMASLELPLPNTTVIRDHISSDYYYRIPVRPIYKSYPVYTGRLR
jgi:hypothetical protein